MLGPNRAGLSCWPLAVVLNACMPIIAHTPEVERGTHLTLAGAFAAGLTQSANDSLRRQLLVFPNAAVRGAYGARSTRDADGFALEVAGELTFPPGVVVDLYVQAPKRWTGEIDFGAGAAGVLTVYKGPTAYVEAGRQISDGFYLFTMQSVAKFQRSRDHDTVLWWQPTIAIEPTSSTGRRRYYFVTATIGRTFAQCERLPIGCYNPSGAMIAIGAAVTPPVRARDRH